MAGTKKNGTRREDGAVMIVEAAFVFPVMFIILFFLIYMGNSFYVKAQIEAITETYAIKGANCCADPILEYMLETDGTPPALNKLKTDPYRYIFGGRGEIEGAIEKDIASAISNSTSSFFKSMKPKLKQNSAEFHSYVVYSTFSVDVQCSLTFPIRLLGSDAAPVLVLKSYAEVPVSDTAEFIRNTDFVIDVVQGTAVGQKISEMFGKINDLLSSFASK